MGRDRIGAVRGVGGGGVEIQEALDSADSVRKVDRVEELSAIVGRVVQQNKASAWS